MNLYVLQKNIQSDTYEWTLDKLNVNRQWSVLIGLAGNFAVLDVVRSWF
jgi:hypothetical protein